MQAGLISGCAEKALPRIGEMARVIKFDDRFSGKILSREKIQTIRRNKDIQKGDTLLLHNSSGLMKQVTCTYTCHMRITKEQCETDCGPWINTDTGQQKEVILTIPHDYMACEEGFESAQDFLNFFEAMYCLPFDGMAIAWGERIW